MLVTQDVNLHSSGAGSFDPIVKKFEAAFTNSSLEYCIRSAVAPYCWCTSKSKFFVSRFGVMVTGEAHLSRVVIVIAPEFVPMELGIALVMVQLIL